MRPEYQHSNLNKREPPKGAAEDDDAGQENQFEEADHHGVEVGRGKLRDPVDQVLREQVGIEDVQVELNAVRIEQSHQQAEACQLQEVPARVLRLPASVADRCVVTLVRKFAIE